MEKERFKSTKRRKADPKNYEESQRNEEWETRPNKRFKRGNYRNKSDFSDGRFSDRKEKIKGKETTEETSKEDFQYLEKVMEKVKIGFYDDEDRELFIENVLKEIENKIVELSCGKKTSYLLQSMVDSCVDANLFIKLMNAISSDLRQMCTNQCGSYIIESLLKLGVMLLQDETKPYRDDILSSLVKFGKYCLNNIDYFLYEDHGVYVLRSLVETLGGIKMGKKISRSRKSKKLKKKPQNIEDNTNIETHEDDETKIILEKVPDEFITQLEEFYNKMSMREDLVSCCMLSQIVCFIQALFVALHNRIPELCQKFIKILMKQMCTQDSEDTLPKTFTHECSSCVIERLLELSNEKNQQWLWKHVFQKSMKLLVVDKISNFIVQRFFKVVQNKEQFQVMLDEIFPLFKTILDMHFAGVLVSIAEACVRLGTYQSQFMQAIMEAFFDDEIELQQLQLVPVLMQLVHNKKQRDLLFQEVSYHGSLIIQHALHFYKPFKIVNSLLGMEYDLKKVACDPRGSRIFDAFVSSQYVGEKNREKMLQIMKPYLGQLACNKHGSRTVDSLWKAGNLKQRITIAQELAKVEKKLYETSFGFHQTKKCALYHFINRNEEWKQVQEEEIKKRKLFKDFLN